jgi:lipoprotein-releasing system permease protein
MALSAVGVVFGVAFFICGQAETQGFQNYFISTILGSKGAIQIGDRFHDSFEEVMERQAGGIVGAENPNSRTYTYGIPEASRYMRELMTYPQIRAVTPVVEKSVMLRAGFRTENAVLEGIDLETHLRATDFASQIVEGALSDFRDNPDALVVGKPMKDKLELKLGQNVFLLAPDGDIRRFKLTNFFETGVNVIDDQRIYCHRRAAQSTVQDPFLTSFILVQLKDPNRAPEISKAIEEHIFHRARSWQEREKGMLQTFTTLRVSAGLGISAIIMLAGFGIYVILTMAVLEKTKEIAILRSMGYTKGDISWIFIYQGFLIAIVGIILGCLAGAGLTYAISQIPIPIRGVFKADHYIVEWNWRHYVIAATLALISVFFASYFPSRRAAAIRPVNILRGSSS